MKKQIMDKQLNYLSKATSMNSLYYENYPNTAKYNWKKINQFILLWFKILNWNLKRENVQSKLGDKKPKK